MIIINELFVKNAHKYLWMKKVDGVDLSKHCARCLIGEYSEQIDVLNDRYENLLLEDGIYYFCGVAIPMIWENNIHLAFRYSEGNHISIDNDFYKIEIKNAERIDISNEYIDCNLKQSKLKRYNTCRNWWFANWYQQNIK